MKLPHLEGMMSSYFHQDYDLSGPDDAATLQAYAAHRSHGDVMATIAEIESLLSTPMEGLLLRFEKATGQGNMTIGETDAEAHRWLETARAVLGTFAVRDEG